MNGVNPRIELGDTALFFNRVDTESGLPCGQKLPVTKCGFAQCRTHRFQLFDNCWIGRIGKQRKSIRSVEVPLRQIFEPSCRSI
jgi:hypothetical protein